MDALEKLIVEKTKEVLKTRHNLVSYTQLLVCVADEVWKSTGRRLPGREYGGWDTVRRVWMKYCEKDPYWKKVTTVFKGQLPPLCGERLQRIKERVYQMLSERKAKIDEKYHVGLITETEARLGKPNAMFEAIRDFGLGMDAVRAIARKIWTKAVPVQAPPAPPVNLESKATNGSETKNISELVVFLASENMALKKSLTAAEKEKERLLDENRALQEKVGALEGNLEQERAKLSQALEELSNCRSRYESARQTILRLNEANNNLVNENMRLAKKNKKLLEANQLLMKSLSQRKQETEVSYKAVVRLPNLNVHGDDTSPFYNAHHI